MEEECIYPIVQDTVPKNRWFYIVPLKRQGYIDALTCASQTVLLTCKIFNKIFHVSMDGYSNYDGRSLFHYQKRMS